MNTSFETIYNRFLSKITDFNLSSDPDYIEEYCFGIIQSSLVKIKPIEHNLSEVVDLAKKEFTVKLNETEIECLAIQMVCEWIEPQVNSTLLTQQYMGTKDEKFYSQSNHLDKLIELRNSQLSRSQKLRRDYIYRHNSYIKV